MRYIKISAIGLIVAHALTELYMVVWLIWPQTATIAINPFVDQSALPSGLSPLWWIKNLTDELLLCYVFFDYAITSRKTSRKKYLVVMTFFFYHIFDAYMYVFNYKQSRWIYIALLAIDAIALLLIFLPIKEKGKVIDMQ